MNASELRAIAPKLDLGPEGWWHSNEIAGVSYPEEGNGLCYLVEDSSFWFRHRNRCILKMIERFPPAGTLFDIGGGNGFVARGLQDCGVDVVLVEPGLAGVRNAVKRGIRHVVRSTLDDAGVMAETLPAIGLFDVVEHIGDDLGFLAALEKLMIPGGRLYITVPAYRWLWSGEDVAAGHSRRYTVPMLRRVLEQAGHQVEFATYLFGFLPLPIFLCRALPYRLGFPSKKIAEETIRSDHEVGNPLVNGILSILTSRELVKLDNLRPLRVGASCMAVARKP